MEIKAIRNIYKLLLRVNTITLIIIFTVSILLLQIIISNIFPTGDDLRPPELGKYLRRGTYFFFLIVIIVPIFETLLFQTLIIHLFSFIMKITKIRCNLIPISISAISFALSHYYNLRYFFQILPVGYVLAFCFLLAIKRGKSNASFTVFTVHSSHNLILFTGDVLLK